jgi:hypothetical protein
VTQVSLEDQIRLEKLFRELPLPEPPKPSLTVIRNPSTRRPARAGEVRHAPASSARVEAPGSRLLTPSEAARIAKVPEAAIHRAWKDGSLARSVDVLDKRTDKVQLSRLVVRFCLPLRLLGSPA